MDGVLEAATALCASKLACSLLFLPSLTACFSPVSFCSCCLLVFTDFLLTVSLSFVCVLRLWLSIPLADVVALRFLLFLSHTYGAVLLLSAPLIALETLVRLLWPHAVSAHRKSSQRLDCRSAKETAAAEEEEEEEEEEEGRDRKLFHVVGYFCCLSLWVMVAVSVRWKWRLAEVCAAACLYTTDSLLRCLPRMHGLLPGVRPPCWGTLLLLLLLILLLLVLLTSGLDSRPRAPAAPVPPAPLAVSCGHGVQMSARLHGDSVLAAHACLPGKSGGRERDRTESGVPLTFIPQEEADLPHRWRVGAFPCPGLEVMIGLGSVLAVFVLPLYLSVNILLVRTVETLLEDCIVSLVSPPEHPADAPPSHSETLV
ncbi:uncharacterized protein LOC115388802 [Salarias fasciatus]|uniref:uncharacterized protein LOC115388802 n=1 Tax=Salarias fasciatus TaxID=181472 RepID=UPI001176784B|nr:uncharacterized protein LOC115388802 [Salarias fasciatus]XP_029947937.1 uncharacterized protein LOC115388802 [Salarias fasciatus]